MRKYMEQKRASEKATCMKTEIIVTEAYKGTKKLSDILADLLYAEYCRKEKKNA
jgi:hypothetical protein